MLRIRKGVVVAKQTLAGQLGLGYAYRSTDIISIVNCQQPVVIEGNHAVLRAAQACALWQFRPGVGRAYAPAAMPFIDPDYAAGAYRMLVLANNRPCAGARSGTGWRVGHADSGRRLGDTGRQL